jgi:hypothetical protein
LEEIKDTQVSFELCNEIMLYCKQYKGNKPEKFWLTATKAAEIQCKQLTNAKEYNDALSVLKNLALPVTQVVGEYFVPPEKFNDGVVLQDNYYSF